MRAKASADKHRYHRPNPNGTCLTRRNAYLSTNGLVIGWEKLMKHPMLRFGTTVLLVLLLALPAFAGRGKKDRKNPNYAADKNWTAPLPMHTFSIRVVGGKLTGAIADRVRLYTDDVKQQFIAGWGLGVERSFQTRHSIGINLDNSYWLVPYVGINGRIRSIYLNWLYRFQPQRKSSVYAMFNYGWADIWASTESRVYNIGSFPFIKVSLGQIFRTTRNNDGRFGIFYRVIFSKNRELIYGKDVDFNTSYVGLEGS